MRKIGFSPSCVLQIPNGCNLEPRHKMESSRYLLSSLWDLRTPYFHMLFAREDALRLYLASYSVWMLMERVGRALDKTSQDEFVSFLHVLLVVQA